MPHLIEIPSSSSSYRSVRYRKYIGRRAIQKNGPKRSETSA
jgi:hypothetical protein